MGSVTFWLYKETRLTHLELEGNVFVWLFSHCVSRLKYSPLEGDQTYTQVAARDRVGKRGLFFPTAVFIIPGPLFQTSFLEKRVSFSKHDFWKHGFCLLKHGFWTNDNVVPNTVFGLFSWTFLRVGFNSVRSLYRYYFSRRRYSDHVATLPWERCKSLLEPKSTMQLDLMLLGHCGSWTNLCTCKRPHQTYQQHEVFIRRLTICCIIPPLNLPYDRRPTYWSSGMRAAFK